MLRRGRRALAFFPCHTGLLTECLAFDEAVARKLPHTAKTCADACVRPSLLCAGWLAKLGANALPGESVSRLWDALVLEGGDVLPRAAAAFSRLRATPCSRRRGGARTTGGTTENGVSGAALLDAAERAAAAHFETDDVVADAVFQARAARESADWARARAERHAARRDEPRLRRELRASARAVPGKRFFFGNQFGRRPCERRRVRVARQRGVRRRVARRRRRRRRRLRGGARGATRRDGAREACGSPRAAAAGARRCARARGWRNRTTRVTRVSHSRRARCARSCAATKRNLLRWRVKRARVARATRACAREGAPSPARLAAATRSAARGVHALRYRDFGIHMRISRVCGRAGKHHALRARRRALARVRAWRRARGAVALAAVASAVAAAAPPARRTKG